MRKNKTAEPLPFPVYFWTIALLTVLGIADSLYLAISHFRVYTDIGYSSFCALSQAVNCDTVSQSSYAVQFGLPISVLGILAYVFFLILLSFIKPRPERIQRMWSLLFFVALLFSLYSVFLALVSTYYIHSYCIMCVIDYAINFALLFFIWLTGKRFRKSGLIQGLWDDFGFLYGHRQKVIPVLGGFSVIVVGLIAFYPNYWEIKPLQDSATVKAGLTNDGHPWIGAANPLLTITEYTDYQCFQCNKIHYYLRQLVNQYPDKLRLVHRHFPMDHRFNPLVTEPYHLRAGPMALLAIYAAEKGVFWKANDYFFQVARTEEGASVDTLADVTGLKKEDLVTALNNKEIRHHLTEDIREGVQLGLTGTPGFVVDGKAYQATLPIEDLLKTLQ